MKPLEIFNNILDSMNLARSDERCFETQFDAHSKWLINHVNSLRVDQGLKPIRTTFETASGISVRANKRGAK